MGKGAGFLLAADEVEVAVELEVEVEGLGKKE
jgi:hypothetical protein